jgi:phospholipid/cholesterol/gamma-HCH transport system substrate-binding protein
MKEQATNRVKLGAFVLIATACLILGLYFIGSNQSFFSKSVNVSVRFNNVGGLLAGNNVRFNGINVGTVSKVFAVSDSIIQVDFAIDESEVKYIYKNAIVSIGTDGLLGNKVVDISPGEGSSTSVEEGDIMIGRNAVEMESSLRTLMVTNDNIRVISENLKNLTQEFNEKSSLFHLLRDTTLSTNVSKAVEQFHVTGQNTAKLTQQLNEIISDIKAGKGTAGQLITDTTIAHKLSSAVDNLNLFVDSMNLAASNIRKATERLNDKNNAAGVLLTDTAFARNLNQSLINIKNSAKNFNDNMEAIKHSWLLRGYFKNKTDSVK